MPAAWSIVLDLPVATPSLNRWLRMHWAQRKRVAEAFAWEVRLATPVGSDQVTEPEHRCLHIHRSGARLLDADNLVGGCKVLVDALVRQRLLHDDSPRWVSHTYTQQTGPAATRIVITRPARKPARRKPG